MIVVFEVITTHMVSGAVIKSSNQMAFLALRDVGNRVMAGDLS